MKKFPFMLLTCLTFIIELGICWFLFSKIGEEGQDTVAVNACLQSVEAHYGSPEHYINTTAYTILDMDGKILYQNQNAVSNTINEAVRNRDTILDIVVDGEVVGKMLIYNTTLQQIRIYKRSIVLTILLCSGVQLLLLLFYYLYLKRTIVDPFEQMNSFAVRIAGGNLDFPLMVDKRHVFGSFTEAFDLMRSELKKAKLAEKKANDDKKEIIAKLSHDIKTPVASIKSTSELGYELAAEDKMKGYFHLINGKSDQITTLVDNLFQSTLHEITEIAVNPTKQNSSVIDELIRNADYLKKAGSYTICDCVVFIDKLRLQQAFDNIFMNSYKYANTAIEVESFIEDEYLVIRISDHGTGVKPEELPLLTEKYKRGSNAGDKDGAGLGLYLTDYFLKEMDGKLILASEDGFSVAFYLRVA